jgi:hypothetical protein
MTDNNNNTIQSIPSIKPESITTTTTSSSTTTTTSSPPNNNNNNETSTSATTNTGTDKPLLLVEFTPTQFFTKQVNESGAQLFTLGTIQSSSLDYRFVPEIPFFALYQDPAPFMIFCVKLPFQIYQENIPEFIQQMLVSIPNSHISSIELFISAQEFLVKDYADHDFQLRAHFWACPGAHPVGIRKKGAIQALLHGFNPEIDKQLLTNRFTRHTWSIHPVKRAGGMTAYSPSNARVRVHQNSANNVGWTIVMDEQSGRVAVTLHGFLSNHPVGQSPADFVQKILSSNENITLGKLVNTMLEESGGGTHGDIIRPFALQLLHLITLKN